MEFFIEFYLFLTPSNPLIGGTIGCIWKVCLGSGSWSSTSMERLFLWYTGAWGVYFGETCESDIPTKFLSLLSLFSGEVAGVLKGASLYYVG